VSSIVSHWGRYFKLKTLASSSARDDAGREARLNVARAALKISATLLYKLCFWLKERPPNKQRVFFPFEGGYFSRVGYRVFPGGEFTRYSQIVGPITVLNPCAAWMMNTMLNAIYPTHIPFIFWPYVLAISLMVAMVGLTILTQFRRVTHENPTETLRVD